MIIRPISDLHLSTDFRLAYESAKHLSRPDQVAVGELWAPPPLVTDSETTLVLAGDLWEKLRFVTKKNTAGKTWLEQVAPRFKYVVLVLGNHDHWELTIDGSYAKLRDYLSKLPVMSNVFVLNDREIVLDGVCFVGGTLWTDFNKGNPITTTTFGLRQTVFNDFRQIRFGPEYRRLRPQHMMERHFRTKQVIFDTAAQASKPVVVVTHMAPSYQSINEKYRTTANEQLNYYYYSELGNEIAYSDIKLWIHGHTHQPSDYMLGGTRVICNPRGHELGGERSGYDPALLITV